MFGALALRQSESRFLVSFEAKSLLMAHTLGALGSIIIYRLTHLASAELSG